MAEREIASRHFQRILDNRWSSDLFVCVGLDSKYGKIPNKVIQDSKGNTLDAIVEFNKQIIRTTHDLVCAYKLNLAFYLAEGCAGLEALHRTVQEIRSISPNVLIILDAKFGDVRHTNSEYARFAFCYLDVDAVTVHPYPNVQSIEPFLEWYNKIAFVLCEPTTVQLYSDEWAKHENIGLVVSAVKSSEFLDTRKVVRDIPILIPGIGNQGGNLKKAVRVGKNSLCRGMLINASRSVIFASEREDFAERAASEVSHLNNQIGEILKKD